jgi:GTP-binding protein
MAASHGRGVGNLLEVITADMPEQDTLQEPDGLKLAIIGRPNVGKSTLVNRLLGEDRVVVYDMPGTTRDSIYIPYQRDGKNYVLIDTAGVRRRGRIEEKVEKFSVIKTLQAIEDSNVTVIVIDAQEGIVDQDLHMIGYALDAGRALVVAINKWDGLSVEQKDYIKIEMDRRFSFIPYVKVHLISALHGTGVGNLYPSILKAYKSSMFEVSTNRLTQILQDAVAANPPPTVSGRRIKLRYAHIGGHNPPVIVIHGNQTGSLPKSYQRYLENQFRQVFKLEGTPLNVVFKLNENPYANKSDTPTKAKAQQLKQRERNRAHKYTSRDKKSDKRKSNKR